MYLLLYGCHRLNLASFVTTWMEPECDELVNEARNVNYIGASDKRTFEVLSCILVVYLFIDILAIHIHCMHSLKYALLWNIL